MPANTLSSSYIELRNDSQGIPRLKITLHTLQPEQTEVSQNE